MNQMVHLVVPLTIPILAAKIADLQKSNQPQSAVPVIPKPKGSSYSLQKKMGLEDDPMKYDEIRVRSTTHLHIITSIHCTSRRSGRN